MGSEMCIRDRDSIVRIVIGTTFGGLASSNRDEVLAEKFRLSKMISAFILKTEDSISVRVVLVSISKAGERMDARNHIFV